MKLGTDRNPKFSNLMALLHCSRPMVAGLLELLWHSTAEFAPQGDIGRFDNRGIAKLVGWKGNPDRLVEALTEARWLDPDPVHRLLVHDWADHMPDFLRKRLDRGKLTVFTPSDPAADNGGQRRTSPPTEPSRAVPNRAVPGPTVPGAAVPCRAVSGEELPPFLEPYRKKATAKALQACVGAIKNRPRLPAGFISWWFTDRWKPEKGSPLDGLKAADHFATALVDKVNHYDRGRRKRFDDLKHLVEQSGVCGEPLPARVVIRGESLDLVKLVSEWGASSPQPPAAESPDPG